MPILQFKLKPSKAYLLVILFIISGALLSIFCSYLPYYIQFLLGLAALVYGGRVIQREVMLQGPRAIVGLVCREDNSWQLQERSGGQVPAVVRGDSTRLGGFSVLRFSTEQGLKRNVVVFYDALGPGNYRQLLMRLATIQVY